MIGFAVPAHAAAVDGPDVMPCYTYIDRISASLTINDNGVITYSGSARSHNNTTVTQIYVSVQEHTSNGWVTRETVGDKVNGFLIAAADDTYQAQPGKEYRAFVRCYIKNTNGTILEYDYVCSPVDEY